MRKIESIETDRLFLRLWSEKDLQPFYELNSNPIACEFFPSLMTQSESDLLVSKLMGCYDKNGFCPWAVELKSTQQFVGMVGLWEIGSMMPFAPGVELGFRILPQFFRQGYVTEASNSVLGIAKNEIGLIEVKASASAKNFRSIECLKKLGFVEEQNLRFEHKGFAVDDVRREHSVFIKKL